MKVFKPRRGKRSTAISKSIILQDGEIFFEIPNEGVGKGKGKIIMGDGIRSYEDLPIFLETGSSSGGIAPSNTTDISIIPGINKLTIKWSDPLDTIIDGQTLCTWSGTKLVMKTGSYPSNENDGTIVIDNTIRDQYKTNGYEITGLTNDTTYYFQLFPYSDQDIVNRNTINRISGSIHSVMSVSLILNGTKNDIITIKDSNNVTVGTCTFESGETSGNITINVPIGGGNYTFVSSVAKDTTSGMSDYEKIVTLTDNLTQTVNVYPDGALIWCGDIVRSFTASALALLHGAYPTITPTINELTNETQFITTCTNSRDTNMGGILFDQKVDLTNVSRIKWVKGTGNSWDCMAICITPDGTSGSGIAWARFNTATEFDVSSYSGEYYIGFELEAPRPVGTTITNGIKQLWFDNYPHENDIRINGAKEDIITITDSNNQSVATCIFESGKTYGYIDKSLLPSGEYTFTSLVAKDTTAGTSDYTKTINITDGVTQVVDVFPLGAIYWWGNGINVSDVQYCRKNPSTESTYYYYCGKKCVIDFTNLSLVKVVGKLVRNYGSTNGLWCISAGSSFPYVPVDDNFGTITNTSISVNSFNISGRYSGVRALFVGAYGRYSNDYGQCDLDNNTHYYEGRVGNYRTSYPEYDARAIGDIYAIIAI